MKGYTIYDSLCLHKQFSSLIVFTGYVATQAITAGALAVADYFMTQKANKFGDEAFEAFFKIGQNAADKGVIYNTFSANLNYFFGFLIIRTLTSKLEEVIYKEMYTRMSKLIQDSLLRKIYQDQNIRVLSANKDTKDKTPLISDDVYNIAETTSRLATGFIRSGIQLSFGLYTIYNMSKSHVAVPILFGITTFAIKSFLHSASTKASESGRTIGSNLKNSLALSTNNADDLFLNGKNNSESKKALSLSDKSFKENKTYNFYSNLSGIWDGMTGNFEILIRYRMFARELFNGRITLAQRGDCEVGISKISMFFNYVTTAIEDMKLLRASINNIRLILDTLAQPLRKGFDQAQDSSGVNVKNVEFKIENQDIKFLKDFTLEAGQRCLVTGESGCGKSTFISLLFGASPGEHVKDVYGAVSLPKKVAYISQAGFFPTDTSVRGFFEESTDQDKLRKLFKAANLESVLEQKDCTKLSGGQKKRLMLIEAILKDPELLVLDEAFTGLDKESTVIMKKMIKANLPNAIVISVMHADPDSFYTHQLSFDKRDTKTRVEFSKVELQRQRSNSIC